MLRYLLPITLLLSVLTICYRPIARMSAIPREPSLELEPFTLPHGRCLYMILERDGVYIGDVCVPTKYLDSVIERMYGNENIDYAILFGSDTARYRDFIDAYVAAKKSLRVPLNIKTYPVATGTRRGPIEVHSHFWEYD